MTDEQIVDFLRSRARVRPPMDLVGSIADAIADEPQRRHSWFAPFIPAAVAVAAAAAVLVAALLVGQGSPDVGPQPGGSPTPVQSAAPTATTTLTPTPTPAPTLLQPGESVSLDAVDAEGRWGGVTLTRGEDVGGYDDGSVSPDDFVIEIEVQYVAEREPNPLEFGAPDWSLVGADGQPVGAVVSTGGRHEAQRPTLSTYPAAIDIFSNDLQGWLLFTVPRSAEDADLGLIYQPAGLTEPAVTIPVRVASAAPQPVAIIDPAPPEAVTYVEQPGYPFTVIVSPEADALFDVPDTCDNPSADGGYTVTYPDAWFDNTEIGEWPACSWFSPAFYAVSEDPNTVPPQIAIVAEFMEGDSGSFEENLLRESVTVGGYPAVRIEDRGAQTMPAAWHSYLYQIQLGDSPEAGPNIVFRTTTEMGGDYNLNKAVLDRIMALIEFTEEAP